MAFLLDPVPTPGESGTPMCNIPRNMSVSLPAPRRVVKDSTVKLLPKIGSRNGRIMGRKPRPPPHRAEELKKMLAGRVRYADLPPSEHINTSLPAVLVPEEVEANRLVETPEPVGGFTRLYNTVSEVLSGFPEATPLEDKWDHLAAWLSTFNNTDRANKTAELCLELYEQLDTSEPTQEPVTIAFVILEQVLLMVLRNTPALKNVMRRVYREITTAIYEQEVGDPAPGDSDFGARFDDRSLYRENVESTRNNALVTITGLKQQAATAKATWSGAVERAGHSFLRIVFRAWCNIVRMERGDPTGEYYEERSAFITEVKTKDTLLTEALGREETLKESETYLRSQVQILSTDLLTAYQNIDDAQHTITQQDEEVERLSGTIASLTAQYKEASSWRERLETLQQSHNSFTAKYTNLVNFCLKLLDKIKGGASEHQSKSDLWTDLSITVEVTQHSLCEWLNSVLAHSPTGREVTSWSGGAHMLQPLGTVLHVLFPSVVNPERYTAFTKEMNFKSKGTMFLAWLRQCGVNLTLSPEDLVAPCSASPSSPIMYQAIAALMYHTFSGGYTARVLGIPQWDLGSEEPTEKTSLLYDQDQAAHLYEVAETWLKEGELWVRRSAEGTAHLVDTLLQQVLMIGKGIEPEVEMNIDEDQLLATVDGEDEEVGSVKEMIKLHASELRKIFSYYAASISGSVGGNILSEQEFMRFVIDTKLMGKTLSRQNLTSLFKYQTSAECTMDEWVLLLVIIAKVKYKTGTVPVKFEKLMSAHVLANSKQMELDLFRKAIYSEKVQGVLSDFNGIVSAVFKQYSEVPKGLTNGAAVMCKAQYDRFLHDIHITDQSCTSYMTDEIFKQIQDPEDDSEDLVFQEFCECLVTIAAVKRPEPYLPLHQRLRYVVETWLAGFRPKRDADKTKKLQRRSTVGSTNSMKARAV